MTHTIEENSPGMDTVESTVVIANALGLHARPAAKLAQTAQRFNSEITLEYDEMAVDAKSILDILSLAAGRGASLVMRCKGDDAKDATSALQAFFSGSDSASA